MVYYVKSFVEGSFYLYPGSEKQEDSDEPWTLAELGRTVLDATQPAISWIDYGCFGLRRWPVDGR